MVWSKKTGYSWSDLVKLDLVYFQEKGKEFMKDKEGVGRYVCSGFILCRGRVGELSA